MEDPFYPPAGDPLEMATGSGGSMAEKVIRRVRAEAEREEVGTVVRMPEPPADGSKMPRGVI